MNLLPARQLNLRPKAVNRPVEAKPREEKQAAEATVQPEKAVEQAGWMRYRVIPGL
jgi:hypothetical protein